MDKNTTKNSVTRSSISSQAIVDAQQTLMIGGYHAESVSRQNQKTPLLGDVPLLGNLFRSTSETHSTRERLFLITPRVMTSVGMAAAEQSKANKAARRIAAAEQRRHADASGTAGAAMPASTPAATAAATAATGAVAASPFRGPSLADTMWPKKSRTVVCKRMGPTWR